MRRALAAALASLLFLGAASARPPRLENLENSSQAAATLADR